MTSVMPPGGHGTMSLIGRDGYSWACAGGDTGRHSAASSRLAAFIAFMVCPSILFRGGAFCAHVRARTIMP
ncbi:hypothetical protein D3C83_64770 [compost metagenome]